MAAAVSLEWKKDSKGYDFRTVRERLHPHYLDPRILDADPTESYAIIVPRGGRAETYPVRDQVLLDLVNMPHSLEGVQSFVNQWGLLRRERATWRDTDFYGESYSLRQALNYTRAENWGQLERAVMGRKVGRMAVRFARIGGESAPRLFLEPDDLISYCWICLMQMVGGGADIQKCLNCGAFFVIGLEKGTRSTRQYCSDRCRIAMHRKNKRKADSPSKRARQR
jgi:hypothetical protein